MGAMLPRARAHMSRTLAEVYALFPRLAERKQQVAGTLSGGEQQMLAIGRCLMGRPELVMFDEPSLGLAPTVVQEVFRTVRTLHERGLTILLVEQNVAVSLKLAQTRLRARERPHRHARDGGGAPRRRPRAAGLHGPLNADRDAVHVRRARRGQWHGSC